jgi:uncharacterized membrane protein YhdT
MNTKAAAKPPPYVVWHKNKKPGIAGLPSYYEFNSSLHQPISYTKVVYLFI